MKKSVKRWTALLLMASLLLGTAFGMVNPQVLFAEELHTDETEVESEADNTENDNAEGESETSNGIAFVQSESVDGIEVTVEAEEGVFPEGAVLSVRKCDASEEESVEEAVADEREDSDHMVASYTFDIKIVDEDGEETAPNGDVKVSFEAEEAENANLQADVYHISGTDESSLNAEKLDVETDGSTISVMTDGFSYYAVEFTYGKLQYVMQGDSEIPLADILDAVGLSGAVTGAESSNTELFAAEETDGVWTVTAKQAFDTEEWLKVTIDGVVYEIRVTDEQESGSSGAWDGTTKISVAENNGVYRIDSPSKLAWFADVAKNGTINFSGKIIEITGNIDFNNKSWTPISVKNRYLSCEKIYIHDCDFKNLTLSLFADLKIDNFEMNHVNYINLNMNNIGGNRGSVVDNLEINNNGKFWCSNLTINGEIIGASKMYHSYKGIVGSLISYLKVDSGAQTDISNVIVDLNCRATVIGGLIQKIESSGSEGQVNIHRVEISGTYTAYDDYGYNKVHCGGIIGEVIGTDVLIEECSVSGNFKADGYYSWCGGIIAKASANSLIINNCICDVTLSSHSPGGILGNSIMKDDGKSKITNSFVTGTSFSMAFVTLNEENDGIPVKNCYFDYQRPNISSKNMYGNGVLGVFWNVTPATNKLTQCRALTTAEAGVTSNFVGWDFGSVWTMGETYPVLRWQNEGIGHDNSETTVITISGKDPEHYYGVEVTDSMDDNILESAVALEEAYNNYLSVLGENVENKVGDKKINYKELAKELRKSDEESTERMVTMNMDVPDTVYDYIYETLAHYMDERLKDSIDFSNLDIKNDNNTMYAIKLVNAIKNGLDSGGEYKRSYGKTTVVFRTQPFQESYFGSIEVVYSGSTKYRGVLSSKADTNKRTISVYLDSVSEIVKDAYVYALTSVISEFRTVTALDEFTKDTLSDWCWRIFFPNRYDDDSLLKKITLHYGNIRDVIMEIYYGYTAIKPIIAITNNIKRMDNILKTEQDIKDMVNTLMDIQYYDIGWFHSWFVDDSVEQAMKAMDSAREKLIRSLCDKGNIDYDNAVKNFKRTHSINCPVDIDIYDKNGILVGYVDTTGEHEGYVYEDEGLKIEVYGDEKIVYVPDGLDINIVFKPTDNGVMNYSIDERVNGASEGRLNFYNVPLTMGEEYEQNCPSDISVKNDEAFVLQGSQGEIKANQYIYASDKDANVSVKCNTAGNGYVFGEGNYPLGDFAELVAFSEEENVFDGWFIDGKLVSEDTVYRFTPLENTVLNASFSKVTSEDYKTNISNETENNNGLNNEGSSSEKISSSENNNGYSLSGSNSNPKLSNENNIWDGKNSSRLSNGNNSLSSSGGSGSNSDSTNIKIAGKGATKAYYTKTGKGIVRYDMPYLDTNAVAIVVPSKVKIGKKEYKVTAISTKAFEGYGKLRSVTIGKNVKKIGKSAFKGCKKLKTITIQSKKLTKKGIKHSLRDSYIKTIRVPLDMAEKYKGIFKKKNVGSKNEITVKEK